MGPFAAKAAGRKAAMHLDNCIRKMTEKYSGQREKQKESRNLQVYKNRTASLEEKASFT